MKTLFTDRNHIYDSHLGLSLFQNMHTVAQQNTRSFDEIIADIALSAEGAMGATAVGVDNLEEGLGLITLGNKEKAGKTFSFTTEPFMMYFVFALEGKVHMGDSLSEGRSIIDSATFRFFVNPRQTATLTLHTEPATKGLLMLISLKKLHEFFLQGPNVAERSSFDALTRSFRQGDSVTQGLLSPAMWVALSQMTASQMNEVFRKLYRKGKILEFFSLYLDQSKRVEVRAADCPYVSNEMDIDRIHMARTILVENMAAPPTLTDLAKRTGLNEFKLKVGFKQVYGNTVYGYLNDLRMETARTMLEGHRHQVKEVAFAIGYNNPSHFISAFKKKYGVTPNKYMEG